MISSTNDSPEFDGDWRHWILERRPDGAILVRVPSSRPPELGGPLPDAVFSFRDGDPQFGLWSQRLLEREQNAG